MSKPILKRDRNDAHQEYWLNDGTQVTGASTIAAWADKKEGLVYWAYKMGRERKDLNRVRQEAADIGSACHLMIEAFIKDMEPELEEFSGKVIGVAKKAYGNFLDFWNRAGFRPYMAEAELKSERYRYGGTFDAVVLDPKDKKVMLDFKVTSGIFLGNDIQLAGNRQLFLENFPEESLDRCGIIRLPKEEKTRAEEKWYFTDMAPEFTIFLDCLKLHNDIAARKKK